MNNLTPKEKAKFCDNQFYKLIQVLLIADNEAYVLFDEVEVRKCRKEIMEVYAKLQKSSDARDTASDSGEAEAEGEQAPL